ncbi:putative phosphonate metabolism protein [Salinihabitans flavidus]|uniref:Putative phosphonate metabolism protein n=1 Tax=Salinihabitans flavidus TaxID=569882 RepID=A0A1H8QWL5_9RHOB|nr:DUF1045 domain-containing protein [Salinihabitans flavidus]SEO58437.1 putative phosphonate metabolism protein [Salinihabitans flavidus]
MKYRRFAVYYTPPVGALAEFGAAWLGWDIARGCAVDHPDVPGLPRPVSELTATPRRYGFHGTVKPPFRLAEGRDAEDLAGAMAALCARRHAVTLDGLELSRIGAFLALTPRGDTAGLKALAASMVRELDAFRAPLTAQEIEKKRHSNLTAAQEENLMTWGYPYVMDQFRFHLTLTGRLSRAEGDSVRAALAPVLDPIRPTPFRITDLTLVGEDEDGMFHTLHRYALTAG